MKWIKNVFRKGPIISPARLKNNPTKIERAWIRNYTPFTLSSNFAPTDLYFFKHLINFLLKKYSQSQGDAETAYNEFIDSRTPDIYVVGINKLVFRWQKITDNNWFYFNYIINKHYYEMSYLTSENRHFHPNTFLNMFNFY